MRPNATRLSLGLLAASILAAGAWWVIGGPRGAPELAPNAGSRAGAPAGGAPTLQGSAAAGDRNAAARPAGTRISTKPRAPTVRP